MVCSPFLSVAIWSEWAGFWFLAPLPRTDRAQCEHGSASGQGLVSGSLLSPCSSSIQVVTPVVPSIMRWTHSVFDAEREMRGKYTYSCPWCRENPLVLRHTLSPSKFDWRVATYHSGDDYIQVGAAIPSEWNSHLCWDDFVRPNGLLSPLFPQNIIAGVWYWYVSACTPASLYVLLWGLDALLSLLPRNRCSDTCVSVGNLVGN